MFIIHYLITNILLYSFICCLFTQIIHLLRFVSVYYHYLIIILFIILHHIINHIIINSNIMFLLFINQYLKVIT